MFLGFGVFCRQTLDATDGKQARRTGASSPLGEYLDHGLCDSIEFVVCQKISSFSKMNPELLVHFHDDVRSWKVRCRLSIFLIYHLCNVLSLYGNVGYVLILVCF